MIKLIVQECSDEERDKNLEEMKRVLELIIRKHYKMETQDRLD